MPICSSPFDMLLAMMSSRFEFAQCMSDAGSTEEKLAELGANAADAVLKHVATHINHVPVEGGKLMLDIVQGSALSDDLKARLRDSIGEKVSMSEKSGGGGNHHGKQVNLHYHNYMYKAEWDTYSNPDVPLVQKWYLLARSFTDKGMPRASEKTKSRAIALVLHLHDSQREVTVAEKLRELDSFKPILTKMFQASPIPQSDEVIEFPERVDDLNLLYPTLYVAAFTRDPPADCRIADEALFMIYGEAMCRKSRAGTSGATTGAMAIRRQPSTTMLQTDALACLQMMLQQVQQPQQSPLHDLIPGLQIFGPQSPPPPAGLNVFGPQSPPPPTSQHTQKQLVSPGLLHPPTPKATTQEVAEPRTDGQDGDTVTSQLTNKLREKKKRACTEPPTIPGTMTHRRNDGRRIPRWRNGLLLLLRGQR